MQERLRHALLCLLVGVALGALVTIPAAILAVASAGAGHGHYSLARLLFPYSMLFTRLAGDEITPPLVAIALFQMPLYGAAIGLAFPWRRLRVHVALSLLVVHLVAAGACFSGVIPNFSTIVAAS